MKIIEAYELVMEKVFELKESGVDVVITPYDWASRTPQEKEAARLNFINYKSILPIDKWSSISLTYENEIERELIQDTGNYLAMVGICFDCGGCGTSRDWEIDWSFRYTGKEEPQHIEARNNCEESILTLNCGTEEE